MDKLSLISYFLEKGILISEDAFGSFPEDLSSISLNKDGPFVLTKQILKTRSFTKSLNWKEFEKSVVDFQLGRSSAVYETFLNLISPSEKPTSLDLEKDMAANVNLDVLEDEPFDDGGRVVVIKSYQEENKKKEIQDFVKHFRARYESLKEIIMARPEMNEATSIGRLKSRNEGEKVTIIGVVTEKNKTKNGNYILKLEDRTGIISVLLSKNKQDIFNQGDEIVLDEVIGITGALGKNIVFANAITFPDIPLTNELKKSPDEVYAVFTGDLHLGIGHFVEKPFEKFISWLCGEYGNEKQKEIAKKVRYLIISGDVIEGIGIYPGQENDLVIKDVYEQYHQIAEHLKKIPKYIKIIIIAGNHDAVRIAEPQPPLDPKYAQGLYDLPNVIHVSNPSLINIHASRDFSGFNMLLYHGFSFIYYADTIQSIREKGGLDRPDLIMELLLKKRHLAPTHGSNLYIPDPNKDSLVISKIPDFFVSGHIHKVSIGNYRNISLVNASCWVNQSENQAKRGIVPHPAKVPIVNLKTREFKIMNFGGLDGSS